MTIRLHAARVLALYLALQQLTFSIPASAALNAPTGLPVDAATVAQHAAGGPARVSTSAYTGDATFSIPIAVPPGTGGLTPQVALAYNSAATRESGPLGIGWSLDIGPSVIQRSTRDGAPAYDATDSFELAGKRLKATATTGRYVSENHDFSRIEHITSGGANYWRVLRPDGKRLYFGHSPGSDPLTGSILYNIQVNAIDPTSTVCPNPFVSCAIRETIVGGLNPFAWYLDRVEDRNGNVVRLQWSSTVGTDPLDPGMRYLTQITYSEHVSGAISAVPSFGGADDGDLDRSRVVAFSYDLSRQDFLPQYRTGFPRQVKHRMTGIDVTVDGSLVRRYVLQYEQSPASGRSRLIHVRERDASGSLSNELVHSFAYGNGGTPTGPEGTYWSALDPGWDLPGSLTYVSSGQDQGIRIIDVNTDGYPDVLRASSGTRLTYLGGPTGFSSSPTSSWALPIDIKNSNGYTGAVFGDFDANGRPDIFQRRIGITGTNLRWELCAGAQPNRHHEVGSGSPTATLEATQARLNTGAGWVSDSPTQRPGIYQYTPQRLDVIAGSSLRSCPYEYLPAADRVDGISGAGFDQGVRVIDMNADGRDDLVYFRDLFGVHPETGSEYQYTAERRAGSLLNTPAGLAAGPLNVYHDSTIAVVNGPSGIAQRWTDFVKFYDNPKWQVPAFSTPVGFGWSNLNTCKAFGNVLADGHTGTERFADLNTDGLPDLVEHETSLALGGPGTVYHRELINHGYGWKVPSVFPEQYFQNFNSNWRHYEVFGGIWGYSISSCADDYPALAVDWGTRLVDINGDGGPDRIGGSIPSDPTNAYQRSGLWSARPLLISSGVFAYWTLTPQWDTPVGFTAQYDLATGARLADVNADGMVDILVSTGAYLNLGEPPDMLETVSSPWGAVTTIEYSPNSDFETAPQANPDVGGQRRDVHPRWVASRITVDPGAAFGQPALTQDFEYYEPIYDVADRAFRGFRRVLALGPVVGSIRKKTETTFHVSDALRGRVRQTVVSSVSAQTETLLSKTLFDYAHGSGNSATATVTFADGSTGTLGSIGDTQTGSAFSVFQSLMGASPVASEAFLAFGVRQTEEQYEGAALPVLAQTRRSFDVYGNTLELARLGDPGTPSDDIVTSMGYVIEDSTGGAGLLLADRPWSIVVTGNASGVPAGTTLVRSTEILYDGNTGNPSGQFLVRGNPTAVRQAWNSGFWGPTTVETRRSFDVYGNLIRVDSPFDVNNSSGLDLAFTTILYDSSSETFPVQITVQSTAGSEYNLITNIAYEQPGCGGPLGMGLPCQLTDPNNQVETHSYDGFGREIASTGPNGAATATIYHDADRATANQRTETRARWSPSGPADPSQDGNALIEVTFYDGLSRTLKEERSGGANAARRMTFYDPAGRVASASRWDFGPDPVASTLYAHDAIGRIVAEALPDGTTSAFVYGQRVTTATTTIPGDGLIHKRVVGEDAHGRLAEVQEFATPTGSPARTTYAYDAFDQLVLLRDAVANDPSLCGSNPACPGQTHETTVFYDQLGNRTRLLDPDSGEWLTDYDARGLVETSLVPNGPLHVFVYDPLGRLESRFSTFNEGDAYTYGLAGTAVPNGVGRIIKVVDGNGEDSFEYDAAGNASLHRRILNGLRFDFARVYDPLGRVVQTAYPDGETATWHFDKRLLARISTVGGAYQGDYLASAAYDALDRPLNFGLGASAALPLATQSWEFDPLSSHLTRIEGSVGGQLVGEANYTVDGAGRVRAQVGQVINPNTGVLQGFNVPTYSYDGLDRPLASGSQWTYDALGNITRKDYQPLPTDSGWVSLDYGDPVRPHALTHAASPGGSRTIDYLYGPGGNVSRKSRTGYQGAPGQGAATVNFSYDSMGRMTVAAASGSAGTTIFTYAADGRRLSTRRGPVRVLMPEPDYEYHLQMQRVNKHFFASGLRVASSARVWSAPVASTPAWLTWRAPDLPELPLGALGVGYGVLGLLLLGAALRRRARHAEGGAFALRLSSLGTLLLVTPALLASPCNMGPPPVTTDLGTHGEPALFYLTDHLGSTILTVEDGGTVRNRYFFMTFGDPGAFADGPTLRHRFLGEEIVAGTGLYMLGARVYDPETGRFLQPDPLVANPADPQAFNRYTYALNNPVNWMDPSGLAFEEGPVGGGGSSGGGRESGSPWGGIIIGGLIGFLDGLFNNDGGGGRRQLPSGPAPESKAGHVPVSGAQTGDWTQEGRPGYFGEAEYQRDVQVANAGNVVSDGEFQVAQARPPVRPPQRGRASRRGPGGRRGEAVFGQLPSRREAYREAKEIGGIPRGQQPELMRSVRLTDQPGNVTTTEFVFRRADGATVTIRNDFLGHTKGHLGPHFNVQVQLQSGATESLPGRGHVLYE